MNQPKNSVVYKLNLINYSFLSKLLFIPLVLTYDIGSSQKIYEDNTSVLSSIVEQQFSNQFDYSYLVELNGKIISSGYSGFTNKKKEQVVNEKTIYNLASINKAFIAVAILQLVEERKLELNTTLGQLFKTTPIEMSTISVQQLLTHKSGLPDEYLAVGEGNSRKALDLIFDVELVSTPGSAFKYANPNYQLLSLIVEKISDQSIEVYLKEKVFVPLDLNDTYFWKDITAEMNIVSTQKRMVKKFGSRDWGYSPIFSAPLDLLKFWNALDGDFLTDQSKSRLFGNYHETASGLQIGFGFYSRQETKWETPEIYTRGTESWGHNAVIRHFPLKETTIIVLTNSGEFGNNKMTGNKTVSNFIANYLFEK